ncbi:MAG: thiamine diphosphokinase [Chloroflexi bacterium]|nr:thiamine diphosphokinase [Chloroflexota bacterium]
MPRIVIFANGLMPEPERVRALLRPDDFLIGADGGARHIMSLGLLPNFVIGDLDSLTEDDMYELGSADVRVDQYPADKDETDLELAIKYALQLDFTSIVIIAALGGRTDQALGNISLLTDLAASNADIRFDDGVEEMFFCRNQAQVKGRSADLVSLIPWGGDVSGVVTTGLKWTLRGETLFSYKTRGISNEMIDGTATVQVQSGLLLIVHRRAD